MNEILQLNDFACGFGALHKMSSRYPEVRSLLNNLANKLNANNSKFTSDQLFQLLPGFNRLESDSIEIKNLTKAILDHTDFQIFNNFVKEFHGTLVFTGKQENFSCKIVL